jgi:hypothetical protein
MVNFIARIRRKPGMTPAGVSRYWREVRAPLV